jgi:hypothetical protein
MPKAKYYALSTAAAKVEYHRNFLKFMGLAQNALLKYPTLNG